MELMWGTGCKFPESFGIFSSFFFISSYLCFNLTRIDVILGADLTYDMEDIPILLKQFYELCTANTVIFLAYPFYYLFFFVSFLYSVLLMLCFFFCLCLFWCLT